MRPNTLTLVSCFGDFLDPDVTELLNNPFSICCNSLKGHFYILHKQKLKFVRQAGLQQNGKRLDVKYIIEKFNN